MGGRAFLRVSRATRDRGMRADDDEKRRERGTAETSRDDDDDTIRNDGENLNLNLGRVTDDDDSYRSIATRV